MENSLGESNHFKESKNFFFVFLTVLFLQSIDSLILNHGMDTKGSKSIPVVCIMFTWLSLFQPKA